MWLEKSYIYIYIHTHTHTHTHICKQRILVIFSCLYLRLYNSCFVCNIYIYIYIYIYIVCVCVYTHTHTHTHTIFFQPHFILLWPSPQRDNKILLQGNSSHKLNSNRLSVDSIPSLPFFISFVLLQFLVIVFLFWAELSSFCFVFLATESAFQNKDLIELL